MNYLNVNVNEFVANLYEGMLIKFNCDPDKYHGVIYKVGKIISFYPYKQVRCTAFVDLGIAFVEWLVIKTIDGINTSPNSCEYIYPCDIPRIKIMTDKDLPELALLSLVVS